MPIEDLIKMYKMQRESATPDTEHEEEEKKSGEDEGKGEEHEEDQECEGDSSNADNDEPGSDPGLELLVSGKTVTEVRNEPLLSTCTVQLRCMWV